MSIDQSRHHFVTFHNLNLSESQHSISPACERATQMPADSSYRLLSLFANMPFLLVQWVFRTHILFINPPFASFQMEINMIKVHAVQLLPVIH